MVVELRLVEQRYAAVLEVINDAASVTDVAFRFGVTRQGTVALSDRGARRAGVGSFFGQIASASSSKAAATRRHSWRASTPSS